jgi:hypothetical protein
MKKFTTQDIIDMGAQLYDSGVYDKLQVRKWLMDVLKAEIADFDLDRIWDLICG